MAGYIGNKAVGLNVTTGDILGDVGVGGVVTANAGVVVDNFTLDGTTLALSSGDFTVDVAGNILLNADGSTIVLADGSLTFGQLFNTNSGDFGIYSPVQDKDMIFIGNDGGSNVNALILDMSAGGAATLNNGLTLTDGNLTVAAGHGIDFAAQTATSAGGASVTSELLDHYEEGTWTPTIVAGTASVNNTATYTKIGRLVTCQLDITYPSQTNNNDADVEGLPFTSANNVAEPGAAVFSNLHASNNLVGFNAKNNTRFRLQDGAGTSTTLTAMAGKVLRATVTYITAT